MSFDEQPDGDIHGECAAETAKAELSAFEMWWAMISKVLYMSKKEIASRAFYAGEMASYELRFDACRPYLKEGETVAGALERLSEARRPTTDECFAAGVGPVRNSGDPYFDSLTRNTEEERARFEAYMRGHCWDVGKYDEKQRCYDTVAVRRLYGVWRDRGSIPSVTNETDAARYRWLREHPQWIGFDLAMEPEEMDASIDHEMRSAE